MGKVVYGLKNVHYAIFDETTKTYGAWKSIPGAVSMSADADTTQNDFYADDAVYATISASNKETGSVEFAAITDDMYVDLFGYATNSATGLAYQKTEPVSTTVALGYEVSGNEGKMRGVRYNVTFTAPSQASNSMTDSTNPDTVTVNYTAIGRDFIVNGETVNVLKGHVNEGSAGYAGFWGDVITPGVSASAADLSSLTLQNVTLSPEFSTAATTYTGIASAASGTITATATDEDATVAIAVNGTAYSSSATYAEGTNTVTVLVTNGAATKLYTIIVTRASA